MSKNQKTVQTISKSPIEPVVMGKSRTVQDISGSSSSSDYNTIPAVSSKSRGSGSIKVYDNSETEQLREQNTL